MELKEIFSVFEKVNFIEIMLIWMSFLIGIRFPDWDFKFKIKHRNILTHSPLILLIMIYFYNSQKNVDIFRFVIIGFAFALSIHMIFDFFPRGWARGALIYFPIANLSLGVNGSKIFIFLTAVYSMYLSIHYTKDYSEIFILLFLGVYTIIKSITKELKFFRPAIFLFITITIFSSMKYDEINNMFLNTVGKVTEIIKNKM